jgi:hypothetical protein
MMILGWILVGPFIGILLLNGLFSGDSIGGT